MGAGIQRWWRSESRLGDECDHWNEQQRARLSNRIRDLPNAKIHTIRPWLAAISKLWRLIAGQPDR